MSARKPIWLLLVSVIVSLALASGMGAAAPAAGRDPHAPPDGWEAHPPLHVHLHSDAVSGVQGYTPAVIRHAYGFDLVGSTGAGQVIALVDAYGSPTLQADVNAFSAKFGLPTTTVQIAYPAGTPYRSDMGWALETSLDVEWAHAIAPAATILLVVAPSAGNSALLTCVDYAAAHAAQVSLSWGGPEFSGETYYDFHFIKPGVSFTVAAGDDGTGAQWPASSPYVVAVGGTTLELSAEGYFLSETAWSGSCGGPSAYETEQTWQRAWQTTGMREMPDVAYDADPNTGFPVYDSTPYDGQSGWFEIGGTSAGAPQWAGLLALVNAKRTTPLTTADNALYGLGKPAALATYFRDLTAGSNDSYSAGKGYDLVTGLGRPRAANMIPALISG